MISASWRRVLAYLGPLSVIPLVEARGDDDAHWHARQGLVLLVVELVMLATCAIGAGTTVLSNASAGIVLLLGLWLLWAAIVALHLVAMVVALNGGRLRVPGVSRVADADWTTLARRLAAVRPR